MLVSTTSLKLLVNHLIHSYHFFVPAVLLNETWGRLSCIQQDNLHFFTFALSSSQKYHVNADLMIQVAEQVDQRIEFHAKE